MGNISVTKKVTRGLKIDPDLWKEVKLRAVKDDTTISMWVEDALKKKIEREKE